MNDTSKTCLAKIQIDNNGNIQRPNLTSDVKLSYERQGTPGKLTFSAPKEAGLDFVEGNSAVLFVNDEPVFVGFVFEKTRDKNGVIKVTAYDQLRYLKNKDTIEMSGQTASQFIKAVAADVGLKCGEICETEYVLEDEFFDGETLFDMFQKNIDSTLAFTGKSFVLYDNVGELTLKDINDMKLNVVINREKLENFDYTSSIDKNTYNCVEVHYSDKRKGIREFKNSEDTFNIKKWGVLRYYEKANEAEGMQSRAENLLKKFNKVERNLSLKNCYGDLRVRGGSGVMVDLDLGDIVVNQYFVCERVTHTFKENIHLMDIDLRGDDFVE